MCRSNRVKFYQEFEIDEAIADARLVQDIADVARRVFAQLLANLVDEHAHVMIHLAVFRPPNFAQKLAVGEDFARVGRQQAQQFIFFRRQVNFLAFDVDAAVDQIDAQIARRRSRVWLALAGSSLVRRSTA